MRNLWTAAKSAAMGARTVMCTCLYGLRDSWENVMFSVTRHLSYTVYRLFLDENFLLFTSVTACWYLDDISNLYVQKFANCISYNQLDKVYQEKIHHYSKPTALFPKSESTSDSLFRVKIFE